MITPEHLQIQDGEDLNDYHVRLFDKQEEYDIDRYTIANLLNKEAGTEYGESKWRKDYQLYKKWEKYIVEKSLNQTQLALYEEARLEQEKEKTRQQDQKREYRKMIRNSARFEKLQDDIKHAVGELEKVKPLPAHSYDKVVTKSDKHGLAILSDWHYGSEVDNKQNQYNKEIFNQRVRKLVDKIIENGRKHSISTLHIAQLGDLISGLIHVSARVQANEDIIEQVKQASEKLAEVISELADAFPNIVYYNVIGNHARTSAKKSDVGISENFEYLVPWFLEARLSHLDNLDIISDKDGYIEAKIFKDDLVFVHGNFDPADRAVVRLPQLLGYVPNLIIGGHIHHKYMKEYGFTTTLTNGSLIGLDDFATQGRYSGKPSQTFIVFDEVDGMECEYRINLQ